MDRHFFFLVQTKKSWRSLLTSQYSGLSGATMTPQTTVVADLTCSEDELSLKPGDAGLCLPRFWAPQSVVLPTGASHMSGLVMCLRQTALSSCAKRNPRAPCVANAA